MPRGTVAYWRFDAAGLAAPGPDGTPVAAGAVARDLTGNGNDLTAERLHGGPPEVLTWSADHHDAQPAHASLRFDGGQGPDRGAVLRTGADAPLNGMTFESGYTIETFLKLPDPFVGDHAWMGILSWEGRSGDAGKHSGWSTDEPTCSLNLSGERFLQFVVYPRAGRRGPDVLEPRRADRPLDARRRRQRRPAHGDLRRRLAYRPQRGRGVDGASPRSASRSPSAAPSSRERTGRASTAGSVTPASWPARCGRTSSSPRSEASGTRTQRDVTFSPHIAVP